MRGSQYPTTSIEIQETVNNACIPQATNKGTAQSVRSELKKDQQVAEDDLSN